MNCIACTHIAKSWSLVQGKIVVGDIQNSICIEMSELFDKLDIPPKEQTILWSMAVNKMCCGHFRNILFTLTKK
jgi:hypothetical protein